jgi:hypothetical protein
MNFIAPVQRLVPERAKPYCDTQTWVFGVVEKWKTIVAAFIVNLVVTNGVEATIHSAPWLWLSNLSPGIGVTWKSAVVLSIAHTIYSGAAHIAEGTRHPFPRT